MTLARFIKKRTAEPDASFGYVNCEVRNMTFAPHMKRDLSDHVKQLAKMFHGLSKEKVLKLAYSFAIANTNRSSIRVPSS